MKSVRSTVLSPLKPPWPNAWGQNIPPNRYCFARRGLRDDQNGCFSRLQWLTGGQPAEMAEVLTLIHHRADMQIRAGA